MLGQNLRLRKIGILAIAIHLLAITGLVLFLVLGIISATKSEAAEIPSLLKKLMPAGTCLCETSAEFNCKLSTSEAQHHKSDWDAELPASVEDTWQFQFGRDHANLGLSDGQCKSAFPGLFEDIYRGVQYRADQGINISIDEIDSVELSRGTVRAIIVDKKLRILASQHMGEDYRKKGLAILHAIHRSISSDGRHVPNIEFIFSVEDMVEQPNQSIWTLARRPHDEKLWLMPDFGFWSWDLQDLGPFDEVVEEVTRDEAFSSWDAKIQKLVWRGKIPMAPKLRRALLDASKGKSWSDVQALVAGDSGSKEDYISAANQCRYMFIAHVEGRSYSGSLKYRQICRSVVLVHKMQWIQHHHYLLVANGTNQNFVEVERDFSDLGAAMNHLIAHPEEAKRIADNSMRTFREQYLTPAAEVCYWRALIQGYAHVAFEPEKYERNSGSGAVDRLRGMRFENFALLESHNQSNFTWT